MLHKNNEGSVKCYKSIFYISQEDKNLGSSAALEVKKQVTSHLCYIYINRLPEASIITAAKFP